MSDRTWEQLPTTMSIPIPPIHLLLIPLPIASLLAVLATDGMYWVTRDSLWSQASLWLVAAGLITGPMSGSVGLIDFMSIDRAEAGIAGWIHILGMGTVLLVTLVSFLLRSADPAGAVLPSGLFLSATTALLLALGAWYGGALYHRRMVAAGWDGGGRGRRPL